VRRINIGYWGVTSRNSEQKAALQALDSAKPYVFITGPAGGGKTLLTQAVALERTLETRSFRKIIYTRLQTQVGADLGALPGDINEKTYPFIAPFLDNLEVLCGNDRVKSDAVHLYITANDDKRRKVFFDPIQTVRGRSLADTFLIVDEVQNLDVATIHALATRITSTSKIVFLGNFAQIDSAKLRTPERNGLYVFLRGLYEQDTEKRYFSHVNLTETQRHPAVDLAEGILRDNTFNDRFAALETKGAVN
jgi:predicted ribonuclease YlaK